MPEAAQIQGLPEQEVRAEWAETHIQQPSAEALRCEFCGYTDEHLVNSDKMDLHLANECPALVKCVGCGQMIEKV
jgi:hypothetical protein